MNGSLTSPILEAAATPTVLFDLAAGCSGVRLSVPDLSAGGGGLLSDEQLDGLLADVGGVRSRLAGFEGQLLVEVERRGRWASGVCTQTQRVSSRVAKRRAKVANRLFGRPNTDDVGLVQVVAALEQAAISEEHAVLIASQTGDYRAAVDAHEAKLVSQASELGYDEFVVWLGTWRADVDRAAGRSPAERQKKDRSASGGTRADDGMYLFTAAHTPVVGAAISKQIAIVDQVLWRLDSKLPKRERRTPAQRRADAHEWLVMRPVRSAKLRLPTDEDAAIEAALGRADVTVMVIATIDDLQAGRGELVDGTAVDLDDLVTQAAKLNLVPAVFDSNGVNLWQGRRHRIPTEPLRQAVIARDRHCTFDGCTVPAEWCQVHHIIWWSRGGTTDPPNLCLLCSDHHHFVHDLGWQITRQPNSTLTWTPPGRSDESRPTATKNTRYPKRADRPSGHTIPRSPESCRGDAGQVSGSGGLSSGLRMNDQWIAQPLSLDSTTALHNSQRDERRQRRTTTLTVPQLDSATRDHGTAHNSIRKQPAGTNGDEDAAAAVDNTPAA